jgi:hypothetical protein
MPVLATGARHWNDEDVLDYFHVLLMVSQDEHPMKNEIRNVIIYRLTGERVCITNPC